MKQPAKNLTGFTLIELIASIFIIMAMTSIFLVNYHGTNQRSQLNVEKQKLVSNIRLAQNYGLGSKTYNGVKTPSGGWGVHFDIADPSHYIIFADVDGDYTYNNNGNDMAKETKALPAGVSINSLTTTIGAIQQSVDKIDVIFYPPDPVTYVNASASTKASIVLKENINNSTATVSVNSFGLIDTD
jgi:type II secretory pathway pseudopilin PulG